MIESQLDQQWDDSGGGHGRYPGMPVAEIAARFRILVGEGKGRSATAILRLTYEQIEARGQLAVPGLAAAVCGAIVMLGLGMRLFVVAESRSQFDRILMAVAGVGLLFAVGALSVKKTNRRAKLQVAEIRRLSMLALDQLVQREDFRAKPLEREHLQTLAALRKVDPATHERVVARLSGTS